MVSVVAATAIIMSCGPQKKELVNDTNCLIGNEKLAKKGRYIAKFNSVTSKAKMVRFSVKKKSYTLKFSDETTWDWTDKIKSLRDLRKKKGTCIAVDIKKVGNKKVITSIKVLSPYKVPAEQLITNAELKKLMKGVPATNKAITIVDARPAGKFMQGAIPGAINIPMPKLKKGPGFKMLPKDKNAIVIFYCGGFHCKLAPFSALLASNKGYKNVKVYHAGYPDWKKKKNPGYSLVKNVNKNLKKKIPMILVDIRKDAAKSHIPGASAINAGNLNTVKAQFPKGKDMKRAPFIVYGKDKSDEKDAFALAYKITALGYKNVSVLKGGFAAFTKSGKAVSNKLVAKIKYVHKKMPGETSAKEFVAMMGTKIPDGVVFLDIRESSEITDDPAMTLLGALNIPLTELDAKVKTLDKSKKYYTFCSTGMRAGLAREILAKNGIKAFYVKARVEGDADSGITFDEKIKISPAQIAKLKKGKLVVRPKKKKLKKSTDDMGC